MSRATTSADDQPPARRAGSAGNVLSVALVVLATLAGLAGGAALYMREEVVNSSAFAGRAVDAVHQPGLQRVLAREIAVQVVEPGLPDLVPARPAIESAAKLVVGSQQFEPIIHVAADHGHRLLFERSGGNAVFDLADAGTVISGALRTLAPRIAKKIPSRADAILLTPRRRSFAAETLRFAETARIAGILLPVVAAMLFALAILIAPDRRRAITRSGITVGIAGVACALALELVRRYVTTGVSTRLRLPEPTIRCQRPIPADG